MKIIFILGSALLLSQPLCAQNEEAKDTLTAQMMMQNLPEVFVKATRPIVKAERGQLVYNMPLLKKLGHSVGIQVRISAERIAC